ncbi:glycosyltransferase family 2 protein [Amnibacterium endophyticum]|uniref:Glycosyltransferase family 2 protein n=1 Tax=Amnibacterium endophyticum TaxID=2109337 RepID=A0ABW4LGT0_9MICO
MKVSVVVPVYNTGPYIRDLLDSLRAQTLDPAEFEVVLVDDGSTDGTPALLDEAAARTPNFRVMHTPNSGWPGRPRNLGIEAARGDYVFLSDHDDRLDPEALERLTAFAEEHGSDVVVGKIVGVGRSAPVRIFRRTVVDAQEDMALLMDSLTPQKLYRRAFLDERGIRFPEGKRRLEDHLFVTKAYLRARRVSIYADRPVYYFVIRDDGQNASRGSVEWNGYFGNAAEAIRVVDEEAPDERTRVAMRRRWLRVEAVSRLRGRSYLRRTDDRARLFAAVRDLLREHYPVQEVDALAVGDRLAGRLALDDRAEDALALAEWEATIRVRPRLVAVRLDPSSARLLLRLTADQRATAAPPAIVSDPPAGYPGPAETAELERVPASARVAVRLRHADSGTVVQAEVEQRVEDGVLHVAAVVDVAGRPELQRPGRWTVVVAVRGIGKVAADPLVVSAEERALVDRTEVRLGARRYRLAVGAARRVVLDVDAADRSARVRRLGGRVLRRLGLRG